MAEIRNERGLLILLPDRIRKKQKRKVPIRPEDREHRRFIMKVLTLRRWYGKDHVELCGEDFHRDKDGNWTGRYYIKVHGKIMIRKRAAGKVAGRLLR